MLMFINDAVVLRVVDADTLVVRVDLGWYVSVQGHIRLLNIDAPERNTDAGKLAIQYVVGLLEAHGSQVRITTYKRDPDRTFTRYLADVRLSDGRDLADVLITEGHGQPYKGQ